MVVASAVLVITLEDAYPGIALAMLSVTVFVLMLWTAGAPRRRPAGRRRGRRRRGRPRAGTPAGCPDAPDGLGLDWDDFDRLRHEWSDERLTHR